MITEKNPFRVFSKWYETAKGTGLKDPEKMTLATVGPDGRPSSRIVLFKDVNDNGFTFFTNFKSRKAREMDLNPYVSAVIFWEDPGFQEQAFQSAPVEHSPQGSVPRQRSLSSSSRALLARARREIDSTPGSGQSWGFSCLRCGGLRPP